MIEIEARLDELKALGLHRRTRLVSGPQGPHVLLDGKPVLLLCSNNYLGLADHPRVREAAADAAMRWGVGAGASRLVSGTMTIHRRLEERLAEFKGREAALLFGSGYLANAGAIAALARPGDVVFSDELNHASIIDGCRLSRAEVFVYDHCDVEHLGWGIGAGRGPRRADRHRQRVLDGRRRRAARGDRRARPPPPPAGARRRGARHRRARPRRPRRARRGRARGRGRRDRRHARARRSAPTARSSPATAQMARYLVNAARTFIFSTAPPPPAVAGALAALELLETAPRLRRQARGRTRARCATRSSSEGFDVARLAHPDRPAGRRRRGRWRCGSARRRSAAACSRRRSGRRRCRR